VGGEEIGCLVGILEVLGSWVDWYLLYWAPFFSLSQAFPHDVSVLSTLFLTTFFPSSSFAFFPD
jgi:hypothetical protein